MGLNLSLKNSRLITLNLYSKNRTMATDCTLRPPLTVRGMKILEKSLFEKTVQIPVVKIPAKFIGRIMGANFMRQFTIERINRLKPIMVAETKNDRIILFNPDQFNEEVRNSVKDTIKDLLEIEPEFETKEFTLTYEDWDIKRCLDAIFDENVRVSSFTITGHIAQLNLRDDAFVYKNILAQIIFDKVGGVRTVVNKLDKINHDFRFFEMELLAGEPDYITEVKEHGITYKLDFSKVFWNTRLATEHHRIANKLGKSSVVFDVFAGIGPFALPAAKKKVIKVFANDLNPASIDYLKTNIKLNNIDADRIESFNMDGAKFISEIVSEKLAEYLQQSEKFNFHVLMNLPTLATSFLPHFKGILYEKIKTNLPQNIDLFIHCYNFIKANEEKPITWYKEQAVLSVKSILDLPNLELEEVYHVRSVSNLKEMFCLTFNLPIDYLLVNKNKRLIECANENRENKIQRLEQ